MTSQGLLGFRYHHTDKLAYNASGSNPDILGLQLLGELRAVDNWEVVKSRIKELTPVAETHRLDYFDGYPVAEIRRHFPDIEYTRPPEDYHELFAPLQGTLAPYLDGRLNFMPDASDFIRDSRHCDWAYVVNLDAEELEVWKGNQTDPNEGGQADRMGYFPCAQERNYDLHDLPNPGIFLNYFYFNGGLASGGPEGRK